MPKEIWYRDLFHKTSDMIQILSLEGNIVKINPAWATAMGCTEAEAVGKNITEFVRPDQRQQYISVRGSILRNKDRQNISTVFVSCKGDEVFVEGSIEYIETGEEVYTRAIFNNVTDKIISQHYRQVSEQRLQTIYTNAPDAIITIDEDQRVVEWNPMAEQMFGYSAGFARGRLIHSLIIPEEYREAHIRGMAQFLATGEGPVLNKTIEVPAETANHEKLMISLTISSVQEVGKWLFIAFINDITKKKKLEDQLSQSLFELVHQRKIDKQKDDFLSIASHELKTPLTSIKVYNQLLQREVQQEHILYLTKQEEQVRRLERLIGDLLDVSKISTGHLLYSKHDFQLDEAIKDSIESASHLSKKHTIKLLSNPATTVHGDKHRIEQVINNLLSNAIKYSPRGSEVTVELSVNNDQAVVSVQDRGEGIPKEYLERIFERFYRVEETKKQSGGLGLGLYISCQIIKAHEGKIWADSEIGKGTTFFIALPVASG